MQFNFEEVQGDNSSIEDFNIDDFFQINDSVIFLADIHSLFYQNPNVEENNAEIFFKSYQKFLQRKIISSSNNKTCLILYNTLQTQNQLGFRGIYQLGDLTPISAEDIKKCENGQEILAEIQQGDDSKFEEALMLCSTLFSNESVQNNQYNRLFLFTNNDNPCQNEAQRQLVSTYINSMQENQIEIELFPLVFEKNKFDFHKFYFQVIKFDQDDYDCGLYDGLDKIEQLQIKLRKKEVVKKPLLRTHLQLSQKNKIGIKAYSVFRKLKTPDALNIDSKTQQEVKRFVKNTQEKEYEVIDIDHIGKFHQAGNEKIPFEKEDLDTMKKLIDENFVIIGFKPRQTLEQYFNYKPSLFLAPDDDLVTNSSQTFDALIKELIREDKIGIAKLKKANSQIKFVALLPQLEKFEDQQMIPSGFHIVFLPYAEDIRDLQEEEVENNDISQEELEQGIKLVYSMSLDQFDPRVLENPNIQKFYSTLQKMALNEQFEEVDDYLQPDQQGLEQNKHIIEEFKNYFFGRKELKQIQEEIETNTELVIEMSDQEYQKLVTQLQEGKISKIKNSDLNKFLNYNEVDHKGLKKKEKFQIAIEMINKINLN